MKEEYRPFVEFEVEQIKNLSGYELTNYLMDFFKLVGKEDRIGLDAETQLDLSDNNRKQEFLEEIYKNIESEDDKKIFLQELMDCTRHLDSDIIEYFGETYVKAPEEETSEEAVGEEETLEEEKTTTMEETTFETETEPEERKEQPKEEKSSEGPEITAYKAKTAEMEKELAELVAKTGGIGAPGSDVPDGPTTDTPASPKPEILEIVEPSNDLVQLINVALASADIKTELKNKQEELRSLQSEITADKAELARKKAAGEQYRVAETHINHLEKRKEELKKEIDALKYRGKIAGENNEYVNTQSIRDVVTHELTYTSEALRAISKLKEQIHDSREYTSTQILSWEARLNQLKLNLNKVDVMLADKPATINITDPDNAKIFRVLKSTFKENNDIRKEFNETVYNITPETKTPGTDDGSTTPDVPTTDNPDLNARINALKEEIAKRKENEAKYYDALNDINKIANDIKAGKTPEELADDVKATKEKIDSITDDKLKEELNKKLEDSLVQKPDNKRPGNKKWIKWVAGLAGLGLGVGAFALGASPLLIYGGAFALKFIATKTHTHLKKKEAEKAATKVKDKNEITGIAPATEKEKGFIDKFKEFMLDEENIRSINWGLNGVMFGYGGAQLATHIHNSLNPNYYSQGTTAPTQTQTTTTGPSISGTPGPQPSGQTPNISVGDSTAGMDLTQGYTNSNMAISGNNPVSLNQSIMNDGQSVIRRIMDAQGNTYMSTEEALKAGKTLNELSFDVARSMDMTNAASRAWANAEIATRGLR